MRVQIQDSSGAYLVGFAKNKLKSLMSERIDLSEPVLERFYETNGFRVQCHAEQDNDFIRIMGGEFQGVLCHPRVVGGNGWNSRGEELPHGPYTYPLIDDDHGTKGLALRNDALKAVLNPSENYGNLYWTDGSSENPYILSWRGTPNRHFELPTDAVVSGLSVLETIIQGTAATYYEDVPVYTPFNSWLYKSGRQYKQAPNWSWPYSGGGVVSRCLILGACRNSNDKKIYIVTQSDHRSAPANAKLDGEVYNLSRPGMFLTLWRAGTQLDGWDLISEVLYSRNGLPWFGNAEGSEFVCSNGDRLTSEGVLTLNTSDYGDYSESGSDNVTISSSFGGRAFFEYLDNTLIWSTVTATFHGTTASENTASVIHESVEAVPLKLDVVPFPLTINGPDVYTPGAYSASGGTAPYTWTYPTVSCGTSQVTVTDVCGDTARKTVRMPTGTWKPVDPLMVWGCASAGGDTVYETSGGTRIRHCLIASGCGRRIPDDGYTYNCTGGVSVSFDPTAVCGSVITSAPTCVPDCATTYDGYTYTGACKKCIDGPAPFIDTWECT